MTDCTDITETAATLSRQWEQQTWARPRLWGQVNDVVVYLLDQRKDVRRDLCIYATNIDARLQLINPLLDRLCRRTCSFCHDTCCAKAAIWYDFKDLLFLHLTLQPVPPGQPMNRQRRVCRYLGPKGCRLPRRARPWTCTLYLCPLQKVRLRRSTPSRIAFFTVVADQIKLSRQGLITAFDRAQTVSGLFGD